MPGSHLTAKRDETRNWKGRADGMHDFEEIAKEGPTKPERPSW